MSVAEEPEPLYCVYRAGDHSVVCYRAVRQQPAEPTDFLSFADIGRQFHWWNHHRAVGVSAWMDLAKARALARRGGYACIAQLDLARADPNVPWAQIGDPAHVTIWAPPPILLQAVVTYVDR